MSCLLGAVIRRSRFREAWRFCPRIVGPERASSASVRSQLAAARKNSSMSPSTPSAVDVGAVVRAAGDAA